MNINQRKILFLLYGDPMMYPPTINAANILADNGWTVDIVGIKYNTNEQIKCSDGVNLIYFDRHRTGLLLRIQFILYCLKCLLISTARKYEWVFSYDMMAVLPGRIASFIGSARWCYHNHDLLDSSAARGWNKWLKNLELWLSNYADIVSFPQEGRARLFASEAGLKNKPIIVLNGPRKEWAAIPHSPFNPLDEFKKNNNKVILYQGCLSSSFQLEKLLEALPLCRSDYGLCFIGKELEEGISEQFLIQAKQLGISQRFIILPILPYDHLPSVTAFADIGIAKLTEEKTGSVNDVLLAGASNKLAEYMAFGLPIIAPDTSANRGFIQDSGHGLVCKVDRESIAECLNRLYDDDGLRHSIKTNNIQYFCDELNYDKQFQVMFNYIK